MSHPRKVLLVGTFCHPRPLSSAQRLANCRPLADHTTTSVSPWFIWMCNVFSSHIVFLVLSSWRSSSWLPYPARILQFSGGDPVRSLEIVGPIRCTFASQQQWLAENDSSTQLARVRTDVLVPDALFLACVHHAPRGGSEMPASLGIGCK